MGHEGSNLQRWEERQGRSIFEFWAGLFLGILWLVLCVPVGAFELRTGKTVLIPQSERIEGDLYVAAEILVIDGWVRGDVVAVGREIRINGRVGAAVIGFLLLWIVPRWSAVVVDRITTGLMQSVLWGIAGLDLRGSLQSRCGVSWILERPAIGSCTSRWGVGLRSLRSAKTV